MYRTEVSFFIALHLNVCNTLLNLFLSLIRYLCIFNSISIICVFPILHVADKLFQDITQSKTVNNFRCNRKTAATQATVFLSTKTYIVVSKILLFYHRPAILLYFLIATIYNHMPQIYLMPIHEDMTILCTSLVPS